MANLNITTKTYFKNGEFHYSIVSLSIPDEAAKIISGAWPFLSKKSCGLTKNQSADCFIEMNGNLIAESINIPTTDTIYGQYVIVEDEDL